MKSVRDFVEAFGEATVDVNWRQQTAIICRQRYGPQAGRQTFLAADPTPELAWVKAAAQLLSGVGLGQIPPEFCGNDVVDFIVLSTDLKKDGIPYFFVAPVTDDAYQYLASDVYGPFDDFKRTASWYTLLGPQGLTVGLALVGLLKLKTYPADVLAEVEKVQLGLDEEDESDE